MSIILVEIQQLVEEYAAIIDAPKYFFPTYGRSEYDAQPFVEIVNDTELHYVVVERGKEIKRVIAKDIDELLYMIFDDITFTMATLNYVHQRKENLDVRIQLFSYQESLLGMINKSWQLRSQERHQKLLK